MKSSKQLLMLCMLLLLSTVATAEVTFENSFLSFLQTWKDKAVAYEEHANMMMYFIWGGGLLTLAAASMPFGDSKPFKVTAFILALSGAALTQYLVTFQVDPKMIAKKARVMKVKIDDFEIKVKNSDLGDDNLSRQLLLDKQKLIIDLTKLDHEIQGVTDDLASVKKVPQEAFYTIQLANYQQPGDCVPLILNLALSDLTVNGQKVEIPESLIKRVQNDTSKLYLAGAGKNTNLDDALSQSDACIISSLRSTLSPLTKDTDNSQEVLVQGVYKLAEVVFTNYQKVDDSYQAVKIVAISKSAITGFYFDLYGNFEDKAQMVTRKQVGTFMIQNSIISNH